jgi:TRAP-type C4-dicarboxylate transport system permease small subunit
VSLVARLAGLLSRAAAMLAAAATVTCLVLICVSVAARYLFGMPLPWIDKAAGWLVVALVLLGAAEAQRRFEHIGVDLAHRGAGPLRRRLVHLLGVVSVGMVAVVLLFAGLEAVAFSRMVGMMTDLEGVPDWWIQALLPVGAAVLLAVALVQVAVLLAGREPEHLPADDGLPRDSLVVPEDRP